MSVTLAPPRTASWTPLPVLLAGTFMVVLDFFIVNVALPAVQADLGASAGALEWVVAGYGLTFAVLLITAGRLGDRYGRRRLFSSASRSSPWPPPRAGWPGAPAPSSPRASPRARPPRS